jgi:hypothetical protein
VPPTDRDVRVARILGLSFVALFTLATTVLLRDLVGLFADPAADFPAHFDTTSERVRHALGAYALTAGGLAFVGFALKLTAAGEPHLRAQGARLTAAIFAGLAGLAAAALATVPLSISFGQIVGDPGIRDAQEILPQLGYVVLMVPAAIAAACSIWLMTQVASRTAALPPWVLVAGYVAAVAQLFSFYTLPLLLVPLWVLVTSLTLKVGTADDPSAGRQRSRGRERTDCHDF